MGLPAPPMSRRPRLAAAQLITMPPSRAVARRATKGRVGSADSRYINTYNDWQFYARKYARTVAVVAFYSNIVATTIGGVRPRVEQMDENGDWQESTQPRFRGIFEHYRNPRAVAAELVEASAYRYAVDGEMAQVITDGSGHVDWWIYAMTSLQIGDSTTLVKDTPNGTVREGTAFMVPNGQVARLWNPDRDNPAYAQAPLMAVIDDLHRYRALGRQAQRIADSRLALNGLLFTPGEAHDKANADLMARSANMSADELAARDVLDEQFAEMAARAFNEDDDIATIAPFGIHYNHEWGAPEYIKTSEGLDQAGIAYRDEARQDVGRGVNIPGSLLENGGPGQLNHWSEWLVDKKFFRTLEPVTNRIFHMDLTATFLPQFLRPNEDPTGLRIGYDATPVIIETDNSEHALALYLAGLLKGEVALEAAGFDPEDRMDRDELSIVLDLLGRGKAEWSAAGGRLSEQRIGAGGNVTAGTVAKTPPDPATAPPAQVGPPPRQTAADAPEPTRREAANTVIQRLASIRRDTGRKLLAAADTTFAEALRRAGVKVGVRARGRGVGDGVRDAALAAVDDGAPLRAHMAAVGLTEHDALDRAFTTYGADVRRWLDVSTAQQRQVVIDAGLDPDRYVPDDERARDAAAGFVVAALTALAYDRLTVGTAATTPIGEVSGVVPAKIITGALDVAQGVSTAQLGTTADEMPRLFRTQRPTPEAAIARDEARHVLDDVRAAVRAGEPTVLPGEVGVVRPRVETITTPGQPSRTVIRPPSVVRQAPPLPEPPVRPEAPVVRPLSPREAPARGDRTAPERPARPEPQVREPDAVPVRADDIIEWTWVHSFYGDTIRPFEPHEDLGFSGFTTQLPGGDLTDDVDPDLAVVGDFPEVEFYAPQDHDGCTCEWVPSIVDPTGEAFRLTAQRPEDEA